MKQYHDLVQHVLEQGVRKENRTGVDTLSTFGYYYEHDLKEGFPILTTKSVSWKNIVIELLWFLSGSKHNEFLERHKCLFWRPWYNDDGTVKNCYGPAWRNFGGHTDQIAWVVEELKRNPMSRRMVVSAWEPEIAERAPLPPCHAMFVMNVQNTEKGSSLCLHLTQRSCDVGLGVPYNLSSYALMLCLFSKFAGITPGIFGHTLIDAHIYTSKPDGSKAEFDHVPGLLQQLSREPKKLPTLKISDNIKSLADLQSFYDSSVTTEEIMSHFVLEGYEPCDPIKLVPAV
jgi:thymidylate synthase